MSVVFLSNTIFLLQVIIIEIWLLFRALHVLIASIYYKKIQKIRMILHAIFVKSNRRRSLLGEATVL